VSVQNTAAPTAVRYAEASNSSYAGYSLPLNLTSLGIPGCFLYVSLDLMLWNGPPAAVPLAIRASAVYAGLTVYLNSRISGGHPWFVAARPGRMVRGVTRGSGGE
jgi:hypothetical protein